MNSKVFIHMNHPVSVLNLNFADVFLNAADLGACGVSENFWVSPTLPGLQIVQIT